MSKKIVSDISANTLQVIINQCCGLVIFYILSRWLSKPEFGEVNWTLAILLTVFNLLSFGIDQLVVKKVASGEPPAAVMALYNTHVMLAGISIALITLFAAKVFPGFFGQHQLIALLGAGKLMIFFSTPFKQTAMGMEQFRALLVMSVVSNLLRCTALTICLAFFTLDLYTVVIIFAAGDLLEWICGYVVTRLTLNLHPGIRFNWPAYRKLLREAAPQAGTVIFTSALARFDWIFLGLFCSAAILAEYSFAYKVYEVATMPLLVIAPILIPRFVKLFNREGGIDATDSRQLSLMLSTQMILATATALLLNLLWMPLVGPLTNYTYSSVNRITILLLSLSIPFLYLNNFLWTTLFAIHRLRLIFGIIAVTFAVNLLGDLALIPLYKAEGAAAAFLLATVTQSISYILKTQTQLTSLNWQKAAGVVFAGIIAGAVYAIWPELWWSRIASFTLFLIILLFIRPLKGAGERLFSQQFIKS